MHSSDLHELNINTIRFLSVDAVEKAKSGHPGMPMGAATIMYVLWIKFLKCNPAEPRWANRDRFILSAGHASMLLYSLLFLTGYDVSLDDLKRFRQEGSKTPGHPEFGITPGVEATTGPLGQGFANGVGVAIAECFLSQRYNRPGYKIIDHYTYSLISDGDIQEGMSSEAASLAGRLKLNKLIYFYDSNGVQQDGKTKLSFSEDVTSRFKSYGWNVIGPIDGMDVATIERAICSAKKEKDRPSLIICNTIIGYGSPNKAGTNLVHGEPLGEEEVLLTKQNLGWHHKLPFFVPTMVLKYFRKAQERGSKSQARWQELFSNYADNFLEEAKELKMLIDGLLPFDIEESIVNLSSHYNEQMSTRDASGLILNVLADRIPVLIGGSADLAGSTRTTLKNCGDFDNNNYSGRNLHFGLREHAMGAISNGIALHGGLLPFCGTFLIFSDYMRPSIRLSAMMKLNLIYIFTHDSIGLGEDGPTHQPVEHIMSLRTIPGLTVIRPADANETAQAWKLSLTRRQGPVALILTRQSVPNLAMISPAKTYSVDKGGYVVWETDNIPRIIFIATGSEVYLAIEAAKVLLNKGFPSRVVSLPSWTIFEEQTQEYKDKILPPQVVNRVSIEAGTPIGWGKYIGLHGKSIGISEYGISAPGKSVYNHFKITVKDIVRIALELL
jgi:transketolase